MCDYLTMFDTLEKALARRLADECGITLLQYRLMAVLDELGEMKSGRLADELDAGPPTITMAIVQLADRSFVNRRENANDMRLVMLSLTEAGVALAKKADEAAKQVLFEYWNMLSNAQLRAILTGAASTVERHGRKREEIEAAKIVSMNTEAVIITKSLVSKALRDAGVSLGEYRVLLAIRVVGGHCCCADVASTLFLKQSDIVSSLKSLEKKGLITRSKSEANRRVRLLALTEQGSARLCVLTKAASKALYSASFCNDEQINVLISIATELASRKRTSNFA